MASTIFGGNRKPSSGMLAIPRQAITRYSTVSLQNQDHKDFVMVPLFVLRRTRLDPIDGEPEFGYRLIAIAFVDKTDSMIWSPRPVANITVLARSYSGSLMDLSNINA